MVLARGATPGIPASGRWSGLGVKPKGENVDRHRYLARRPVVKPK